MRPEQVLLLGLAAVGALLLLLRAVLARDEPWWVAWPLPAGAVLALLAFLAGPSWLLVPAIAGVGAGLATQLTWAYRRGRYLEDDVLSVWRHIRGRPSRRPGRHRVRDE